MNQQKNKMAKARKYILWGWALFIASALSFIVAAIRSGDWISFAGAFFFLLANIVFLVPVLKRWE